MTPEEDARSVLGAIQKSREALKSELLRWRDFKYGVYDSSRRCEIQFAGYFEYDLREFGLELNHRDHQLLELYEQFPTDAPEAPGDFELILDKWQAGISVCIWLAGLQEENDDE